MEPVIPILRRRLGDGCVPKAAPFDPVPAFYSRASARQEIGTGHMHVGGRGIVKQDDVYVHTALVSPARYARPEGRRSFVLPALQ